MPTHRVNNAIQGVTRQKSPDHGGDDVADPPIGESLDAITEQLLPLRPAPNDVLGEIVIQAGSCLDETTDPARPGWLFDDTTEPDTAAQMCADCPVRYACLELELRLFGAAKPGMGGALGEDGRRALHPVWLQAREDATGAESRGDR